MAKDPAADVAEVAPAPPASKGPLILALLNTAVILGALGFLAYSRLIFKRPQITEDEERARIAAKAKASTATINNPGVITFEQMTINLQPAPSQPKADENGKLQGKPHFCTLAFGLEIRDIGQKERVEEIRPILIDRLLTLLGKKAFHELTTVQGRYLLRQQIIEMTNELLPNKKGSPLATDVYFTMFVVQ